MPDKAIDLIDEASVKSRLKTYIEPENIKKLEDKFEKTIREKEDAINVQDFEKAAKLRDKEKELSKKLEDESEKWRDARTNKVINIEKEDIATIVSNWTGIPLAKISESETEKLKNLENELHKRVVGQEEAVSAVARAIRRSRVGLKDPNRPIGSFLFLGPTGVGKTELTKALAESLFGSESSMIRVDMSEFMEQHSVSKLIGSPPGYVGYEEAGGLTEQVRKKLYSVILFDEIEKAHPDVMNLLLQILDDGRLTDSQGRVVNFKNTVIIMTSNIGARNITDKKTLGFGNSKSDEEYENIKKDVMQEVKQMLKPEFINRIDEIIVFHKLTRNNIENIIDIMLDGVKEKMLKQNVSLNVEQSAKEFILDHGIDENFGARPLKRTIQNYIEDKLAESILDGISKENNELIISAENNEIVVKTES